MKRANIKILALLLSLIVLPPLMWELKSQVGVVPGIGVPNNAVQGASNLTTAGAIPYVSSSGTLSQDTALFWDATGNILQIGGGTINAYKLQVRGSPGLYLEDGFRADLASRYAVYTPFGGISIEGNVASYIRGPVGIGPSNTSPTGTLHVYDATASTGVTTLTVRAGAGQSSTNLLEVKDNSGNNLASVSSAGNGTFSGNVSGSSVVAAAAGLVLWGGRTVMAATADGNLFLANNAATDFGRLQFGGTTSSFPAAKRFGNALAVRAADDTVPTFATLTTCAAGGEGALSPVSDSTTAVWGATITGGGTDHVLAYCNGTNWTVAAK